MKKALRDNLIVSIDDRDTGDHEVMTLKTTSRHNIIIEFNGATNKMSVDPDDLQEALDKVKEFVKARPPQPEALQPLGVRHLEAQQEQETNADSQIKALEKDFSN
jgi:hypothetical protein